MPHEAISSHAPVTAAAGLAPFAPDRPDIIMPLNAVIVYEDAAAGKHAMRVLRRLCAHPNAQADLRPLLWRFDLLEDPRCRALAITDADAAALIIFATSDAGDLPEAINTWSAQCLARKRGQRLAIVTLFGADDTWAVWIQDESQIRTKRQSARARALALPAFEEAIRAA